MTRVELLEKISSNVLKVLEEGPVQDLGFGIKQHSIKVLIMVENGSQINSQEYHVIDEGLETEQAYFMNGRELKNFNLQPPTREQKILATLTQLQEVGTVKGIDISHLDIRYAQIELAGIKKFVAELDNQLILIDAV